MAVARIVERPVTSRRAEICRTAARIFRDRGFDATSVSDIARALRMTKAGLYHYFDSKEALLFEIMTFGLERVHDEVVIPATRIRDPEARLRQIVITHARITTRAQGAVTQLFDETPALSPVGPQIHQRAATPLFSADTRHARGASQGGSPAGCRPHSGRVQHHWHDPLAAEMVSPKRTSDQRAGRVARLQTWRSRGCCAPAPTVVAANEATRLRRSPPRRARNAALKSAA